MRFCHIQAAKSKRGSVSAAARIMARLAVSGLTPHSGHAGFGHRFAKSRPRWMLPAGFPSISGIAASGKSVVETQPTLRNSSWGIGPRTGSPCSRGTGPSGKGCGQFRGIWKVFSEGVACSTGCGSVPERDLFRLVWPLPEGRPS